MKIFRVLAPALFLGGCAIHIQAQDAKQIVQQAVSVELAANRTITHAGYFTRSIASRRTNVVQWVAQTPKGDITRVLTREIRRISKVQQQQDIKNFIHDPGAQAIQRQGSRHDDQQATAFLKLLPVASVLVQTGTYDRATMLNFKPDPHSQPPSRQVRVFSPMEEDMTSTTTVIEFRK